MPEGPTCHRAARDLTQWLGGQKIRVSSPQGRFEYEAKQLDGKTLQRVTAWGKHIFYEFAGDRIVHVHLGLYGKYRKHDNPPPEPRGAVRVRMTGREATVDLNGPNQCELIDSEGVSEIIARLGPDPLRPDSDAKKAIDRIRRSRTPIGVLLMDQSVIAGLGNIYRAELLWLHRVHPKTPGTAVTPAVLRKIWRDAQRLMELAVETGRIITKLDYPADRPPAKLTKRQRFNIYKIEKCPRCRSPIARFTQAGRNVYACETCQPLPSTD